MNNKKNAKDKIIKTIYLLCSMLFFIGKINTFNMILHYIGVGEEKTIISTVIFVLMDIAIGLYLLSVFKRKKNFLSLVIVVLIGIVYGVCYIITGKYYELMQYICFCVPILLVTYLIVFDDNGDSNFISSFYRLAPVISFASVIYVIYLFLGTPDSTTLVNVYGMHYGDIAFAFMPFVIFYVIRYTEENYKKILFPLALIEVGIVYTGLRSSIICIGFFYIIYILFSFIIKTMDMEKFKRMVVTAVMFVVIFVMCGRVIPIPQGSRLRVTYGHFNKENTMQSVINDRKTKSKIEEPQLEEKEVEKKEVEETQVEVQKIEEQPAIKKSDVEENLIKKPEVEGTTIEEEIVNVNKGPGVTNPLMVWNVDETKYEHIDSVLIHYIVKMDTTRYETERILKSDIKNKTGEYVLVTDSQIQTLLEYGVPISNRVFLWTCTLDEFRKSPLIGNGVLYFQNKYVDYFPHNVVLEMLCDYGIIGVLIIGVLMIVLFIKTILYIKNNKDKNIFIILVFALTYIPSHLLYSSVYSNNQLIFLFTLLVLYNIKNMKYNKSEV